MLELPGSLGDVPMVVRVMTLRFEPVFEAINDAPLRDFVEDKDVLAVRDHFFLRNAVPYLAAVATYRLRALTEPMVQVALPMTKERGGT